MKIPLGITTPARNAQTLPRAKTRPRRFSAKFLFAALAASSCLPLTARAQDPPPAPPLVREEPDHLTPVDPYPGSWTGRYRAQIRSRLKLESRAFVQMIARPGASPEFAVRLAGVENLFDFKANEKFRLTYASADKNIWASMPEH